MFSTLILICAMGIAPSECSMSTATDVVVGPRASLHQCMMSGQTMIANTRIAPEFSKQYEKVLCRQTASR